MEWIRGLQRAIDYVEDHLEEEINYKEAAAQAYSSVFHFQRIFSILCGITLGDYIRLRRLTLAGSELASTDCKVIDAALKYGYESPESFSRAFMKFHHISPSQAKAKPAELKSFSRLSVKIILEGGNLMDYRIEKRDGFQAVIKKERFTGSGELTHNQISSLWAECSKDGTIVSMCKCMDAESCFKDGVLGICFDNPSEGDYDYAIGVYYDGHSEIPKGLSIAEIPPQTWAAFRCKGAMPDAFQKMWKMIYTEFFPTSVHQPAGGMCLEVYYSDKVKADDYECEIWVSVQEKQKKDK